eukprot:4384186-Prymnesium_polylepis.1
MWPRVPIVAASIRLHQPDSCRFDARRVRRAADLFRFAASEGPRRVPLLLLVVVPFRNDGNVPRGEACD